MPRGATAESLLAAFRNAGKRTHVVGDAGAGVIAALDLEGRLFAVVEGEVLNRVNFEAVSGQSTAARYLNPGGDGLWPSPEGTTLGYHYPAGFWRVPPGVRSARYLVTETAENGATMVAEVDLVNNRGAGLPALFKRTIGVEPGERRLKLIVTESITYLGAMTLADGEGLLSPWSLSQFDCGTGCAVAFPCEDRDDVWDLYDPPASGRLVWEEDRCLALTDGSSRFQIALGERVPWIEFRDPGRGLVVRRHAGPPAEGQGYIDIRDAAPDAAPGKRGVRYSVYSDTSGFMEIEAAGGCPPTIEPNAEMKITITTEFIRTKV